MYELSCSNDHRKTVNADKLSAMIEDEDQWRCKKCNEDWFIQGDFVLECQVCSMVFEAASLEEASNTIELGCSHCDEYGFGGRIAVPNSVGYMELMYEWVKEGKKASKLIRKGRTDYWEGLVHFCTKSEFCSIYEDGIIKANPTGYFTSPAVCLTEATPDNFQEIAAKHGTFGYVFLKKDIIALGGGPILNLSKEQIRSQEALGFSPMIKPFVQLLRIPSVSPSQKKHDWLHEREWRSPVDIRLEETKPFAVIADNGFIPNDKHRRSILNAKIDFHDLE